MTQVEFDPSSFLADLRRIAASPREDVAQAGFSAAAQTIAAAARRNAGVGRHPVREWNGVKWNPGTLQRSIKSRAASRRARDLYKGPAAYAYVAVLRGSPQARHAHLVEFGSRNRQPRNGKLLVFENYGRMVFTRRVADQKPTFFFRRAVQSSAASALDRAKRAMERVIARAAS